MPKVQYEKITLHTKKLNNAHQPDTKTCLGTIYLFISTTSLFYKIFNSTTSVILSYKTLNSDVVKLQKNTTLILDYDPNK